MARNRFVTSETVRLDLSDGDWIEVKRRLRYGEQQALAFAAMTGRKPGDEVTMDMARFNVARLNTWLVDWSFRGADDKPVPFSPAAVDALDAATAEEIHAALDRHMEEQDEGKTQTATSNGSAPK